MNMTHLRILALAAVAVSVTGCVTHRVTPALSRAVVEARQHKHAGGAECADLESPMSIGFAFGDAALSELATSALEEVGQELACHPGATGLIVGQADNHGTTAEQTALAKARAAAVIDYLSAHKIPAARLQTQVMGNPPAGDANRLVVLAEGRRW